LHTLSSEERDLLTVVRGYVANEVAPAAAAHEAEHTFPLETFRSLGRMDLLGLPMPEDVGGAGLPYRTYLLVLEELARGHATLALAVSVHTLVMSVIDHGGTDEQRQAFLPAMVSGEHLGAYSLSEPEAGSDAAALGCTATSDGDGFRLNGTKAWVTHGGIADRHVVFARTGGEGAAGVSAFVVDDPSPGMTVLAPEVKMGLTGSPTTQVVYDDTPVGADRLLGAEEGQGFRQAMSGLDGGRLGIAAVSTGVAQASLDAALAYAKERRQFGRPIIEFQGLSFILADMATRIEAARALYKDAAGRRDHSLSLPPDERYDVGKACSMAKLFCTDTAMAVTTDGVQVLGGAGYTRDFPVERYMREAKIMQIFEGTNQIQRVVIGRRLAEGR
jgi:alkylation response protein AidB-like acyl-CoA dehydrogenase